MCKGPGIGSQLLVPQKEEGPSIPAVHLALDMPPMRDGRSRTLEHPVTLPWNDPTHSFIFSSRKGNRGTDKDEEYVGLGLRLYTENKAARCWQSPRGEFA